jgi:lipoprotein-anchoring transpeptidase ErfK/SrfK
VSIRNQTLVAYEGEVPVYATLVSTGAEGLLDAETHRATVQGDFLIHTKHVTSTMDSDVEGDAYDLRDVPYVQYFSGGTALHAAFWHDAFGTPRSHGCINLSPLDARWLFDWSEPRVPRPWHGAMSLLGGTLVRVHP